MKFISAALLGLVSFSSMAQIHFGTSFEYSEAKIFKKKNDNYHNNILYQNPDAGYLQCQKDHAVILDLVKARYQKNINRIIGKISDLTRTNEYKGMVRGALREELLKNLLNYVVMNEMKKELLSKNLKEVANSEYNNSKVKRKKVFEMRYANVNIDAYFNKALETAADYKFDNSIPGWFIEEVKQGLVDEMVNELSVNLYRVLVNGVAIEFSKNVFAGAITKQAFATGLKKAVISFSGNVIASVGEGILIEILTIPLKGSRPSPEGMWLDLIAEHPGIMVNPELMKAAGIYDATWPTHCNTINRRATSLEKQINKLLKNIDQETSKGLSEVNNYLKDAKYDPANDYRKEIDNTFVKKPLSAHH